MQKKSKETTQGKGGRENEERGGGGIKLENGKGRRKTKRQTLRPFCGHGLRLARGTAMGLGTETVRGSLCAVDLCRGRGGGKGGGEGGEGNVAEANWRPHFLSYAK